MRAAAALVLLLTACGPGRAEQLTVEVLRELPHDPEAFTQGLELVDGMLYESTGLVGRSSLREVDLETGEVVRLRQLPAPYFAEGLTAVGDELLQLTWRSGVLFRWAKATFEPTGEERYEGEGWGICFDGERLWMSDGSSHLVARDPADFAVLREVAVVRDEQALTRLNELECVDGAVYANVWLSDEIVRIDPSSGAVTATIDASPLRRLLPGPLSADAVLNGIAHLPAEDAFLVTGKLWPRSFVVRFVPAP